MLAEWGLLPVILSCRLSDWCRNYFHRNFATMNKMQYSSSIRRYYLQTYEIDLLMNQIAAWSEMIDNKHFPFRLDRSSILSLILNISKGKNKRDWKKRSANGWLTRLMWGRWSNVFFHFEISWRMWRKNTTLKLHLILCFFSFIFYVGNYRCFLCYLSSCLL